MPGKVSVLMPVYQEGPFVGRILGDLLTQDLRRANGETVSLEVLVIDGGSTDETVTRVSEIAARDSRVRLLHNPARLSSAARALGVEAAKGDWLAVIDGHCRLPSRTLVRDMVDLFERTGADCLARP